MQYLKNIKLEKIHKEEHIRILNKINKLKLIKTM